MGTTNLPKVLTDSPAEYPAAAKWNDNFSHLNQTPASQIPNGDFEAFTGSVPTSWTLSGTGAVSASDADSKRGALAVKLTYGSAAAQLKATTPEFKSLKSRTIRAWCWVKCSTPNAARIRVSDGVGSTDSAYHTGGGTYELLQVTHVANASASEIALNLRVEVAGNALFDAAVLVDSESLLGFMPFLPDLSNPNTELTVGRVNLTGATNTPPTGNQLSKEGTIKAWVSFVGASGAINASFNVLSVVRNSTGSYTITWRTAFADANYCVAFMARDATLEIFCSLHSKTTTTIEVHAVRDNGTAADPTECMLMVVGNQ